MNRSCLDISSLVWSFALTWYVSLLSFTACGPLGKHLDRNPPIKFCTMTVFFLLTWQSCFVFVACSAAFFFFFQGVFFFFLRMKGRACELRKKSDHLVCKKIYTLLINDYSPFISRMRTSDGTWSSGSTPNFVQKMKKIKKKHNL